jgi:hypothetical protein
MTVGVAAPLIVAALVNWNDIVSVFHSVGRSRVEGQLTARSTSQALIVRPN